MRRYRVFAALISVVLLLAGCTSLSLNGPDILNPPSAGGDRAKIQTLIEERSGGDYSFLYPVDGDHKSSVIFNDIDGDGDDEAIALYAAESKAHVLFAQKSRNGFSFIADEELDASRVDRVDFADVNGDGRDEFIIGYTDISSPFSSLTIFTMGDTLARYDMPYSYSGYVIGDLTESGYDDILLLTLANVSGTAQAHLMTCTDSDFSDIASCEMDLELSSYAKLVFGNISDSVRGAVVDGVKSSGEYTTQVICFDAATRTLMNPLYIFSGYSSTKRTSLISSSDIDRDGIIEIPVCSDMPYADGEDPDSVCRQVSWNSYDLGLMSLVPKKTAVLCEDMNFMFHLNDERVGAVTARYTSDTAMSLYLWEYADGTLSTTTKLLTIKYYNKSDFDSNKIIEAVLIETNQGVYTYTIDTTGYLSYTDEEVVDSFVLIDN